MAGLVYTSSDPYVLSPHDDADELRCVAPRSGGGGIAGATFCFIGAFHMKVHTLGLGGDACWAEPAR